MQKEFDQKIEKLEKEQKQNLSQIEKEK